MAFWPVFCFSAKRNKGCFSVTPAGTRSIVNVGNVFGGPNSPTKFCADGPNFRVHILAILAQKRPNLAKIGIFGHFGARPCWFIWCPVGGLVGGCGARAVSRKTPIYFIISSVLFHYSAFKLVTFILTVNFTIATGH